MIVGAAGKLSPFVNGAVRPGNFGCVFAAANVLAESPVIALGQFDTASPARVGCDAAVDERLNRVGVIEDITRPACRCVAFNYPRNCRVCAA